MDASIHTREQVYSPCGKIFEAIISLDGKFIAIATVTQLLLVGILL